MTTTPEQTPNRFWPNYVDPAVPPFQVFADYKNECLWVRSYPIKRTGLCTTLEGERLGPNYEDYSVWDVPRQTAFSLPIRIADEREWARCMLADGVAHVVGATIAYLTR